MGTDATEDRSSCEADAGRQRHQRRHPPPRPEAGGGPRGRRARLQAAVAPRTSRVRSVPGFVHPKPEAHQLIALELWKAIQERGLLGGAGDADEAADAYARATRADPGNAPAWSRLGVVLSERGRQPDAEAALRRAVELDGDNPDFVADLGVVLLFQSKSRDAEGAFRRALALRPDNLRARNGLAAALTETGALEEAEGISRENLRMLSGDAAAQSGLAILERRRQAGR